MLLFVSPLPSGFTLVAYWFPHIFIHLYSFQHAPIFMNFSFYTCLCVRSVDITTFWRAVSLPVWWRSTTPSWSAAQTPLRSSLAWGTSWAATLTLSWTMCQWWRDYVSMSRWRCSNADWASSRIHCSGVFVGLLVCVYSTQFNVSGLITESLSNQKVSYW